MTQDELKSISAAIAEALQLVSDAKRSAEMARDEAQKLKWLARRDTGMRTYADAAAVAAGASAKSAGAALDAFETLMATAAPNDMEFGLPRARA